MYAHAKTTTPPYIHNESTLLESKFLLLDNYIIKIEKSVTINFNKDENRIRISTNIGYDDIKYNSEMETYEAYNKISNILNVS